MREKMILDTDIGDDTDDALALVFAMLSRSVELAGVTTAGGSTRLRAQIADHLLCAFGRGDIPVRQGCGVPLRGSLDFGKEPGQYCVVSEEYRNRSYGDAVEFILRSMRSGHCLTIVAIGPLTNIAQCILRDPETMKAYKLVIMGGMITKAYPEGNIAADPEAADIVFSHPMEKVMIGLDVTLRCTLPHHRLDALYRRTEEPYRLLTQLIRTWQHNTLACLLHQWGRTGIDVEQSDVGAHDPMAVAYAICPSLFTLRDAHVLVETEGKHTRGVTVDDCNVFLGTPNGRNCRVAVDVDTDSFLELFFHTILGDEP